MAQTMTILGDMGEQPQGDMSVYYQPPPEPENDVQITGGLPINLDSLRDGPPGTKPFYPYSTLIRCVVLRRWKLRRY